MYSIPFVIAEGFICFRHHKKESFLGLEIEMAIILKLLRQKRISNSLYLFWNNDFWLSFYEKLKYSF